MKAPGGRKRAGDLASYGVVLTLLASIALSVIPFSTPALADPPRPPVVQSDRSRDDASRQRDIERERAIADELKRQVDLQRNLKALEANALRREIERQAERMRRESVTLVARADRRTERADKSKVTPPGSSVPIPLQACNDATPQEALAPAGSVLLIGKAWLTMNRGLGEAFARGTTVELSIGGVAIPNAERFFVTPAPLDHPTLGRVWITRWEYPLTITTPSPIAVSVRWTLERRLADSVFNENGTPLGPQDFSVALSCTLIPAVTVSGRITGAGVGLSDGRVTAHHAMTGISRAGADTNATGDWVLLLRPGSYRFFFFTLSGPWIPEWWDNQTSFSVATIVTLSFGAADPRLLADLESGVFLSGRVTDAETHQALPGVAVGAQRADVVCCETFGATTDADGRYRMAVRKNVTLRVGFHPQSAAVPYVEQWWNAKPSFDTADLLAVGAADVASVDAALERGLFVRGRVTDAETGQPLENASVTAQAVSETCCVQFFASTNAQGEYAMSVRKNITLIVGFFPPVSPLAYLPSYWNGQRSFSEADQLAVGAVDVAGINGALELGVFMRGRVTDAVTGAGIAGLPVVAFVAPCCVNFFAITAVDGTYLMAVERNVTLRVQFFAGFGSSIPYLSQWYRGRTNFSDADLITVTTVDVAGIDAALEHGVFLRGRVTDADTGAAIAEANVTVFPVGVPCCDNTFASTDAAGDYAVVVRKSSTVKVIFDKPFGTTIPYLSQWYDGKSTIDSADLIVVGSADTLGINAALERGVALRGRVTDAVTGSGVGSVGINAQRVDGPCCETFFASTDADGNYSVTMRSGLTVKVGFFPAPDDPMAHLSEWWNDRATFAEADAVLVGADGRSGIDAVLERGVSVRGRVTDAQTGVGLASASVNAQRVDISCCELFFASTDSDGNYAMTLRPGVSVKVGFFPAFNDPVAHLTEWWHDRKTFQDADVLVTSTDVDGIDAALERGVFLRGHVTEAETGHDLPQVNVNASLIDGQCCENFFGFTDAAGEYTMAVRTNVNLKVVFFPPFGSELLQEYYDNKPDFGTANVVAVGATEVSGINAALERGVRLSGRVSDASGAGIADVSVNVETENCCLFVSGTGTAFDGSYSVTVRPGRYKVAFYPQQSSGFLSEYYDDQPNSSVATVVVVGASPVTGVNATLERGVLISGRVTDAASGTGVQGIFVSVQTAACCDGIAGTQTASDGAYSVAVRPGSYKVGFFPPSTSDLFYEFYDNVRDVFAATVLVVAAAPVSGIDAALDRGVLISGRVRDPEGIGASNVSVNLTNPTTGQWIAGTGTNFDGTYSLTVQPGSYKLDFSPQPSSGLLYEYFNNKATFADADVLTAVVGTALVNIDATLERGVFISGRVTDDTATGVPGVSVSIQTPACCAGVTGTQTGADGTYSVAVAPGSYKVGFFPPSTSDLFYEFFGNTRDFNAATTIVVGTTSVSGVDAALERGVRVSGRVRDPEGLGAPNVSVNLESPTDCNWLRGALTNSDGTYSLTVQPGSYKVSFAPLPSTGLLSERYNDKATCTSAEVLTAVVGTPLVLDATLERGVQLSGRVTNAGGLGIQGVPVGVQSPACCEGVAGTQTAADGSYSLTIRPGSYKVGFFPSVDSGYLREFYNNTRDFSAATVVVVGASPVTGIDAELERLTIVDARRVTDAPPSSDFIERGDAFSFTFSGPMDTNTTGDTVRIQDQDGTGATLRCGAAPNHVVCSWNPEGTTVTVTVESGLTEFDDGTTPGMAIPFLITVLTGFSGVEGHVVDMLGSTDRLVDAE